MLTRTPPEVALSIFAEIIAARGTAPPMAEAVATPAVTPEPVGAATAVDPVGGHGLLMKNPVRA